MKLKDFDYDLPKNLIAQKPVNPRDHSRLLVLDRISGKIKHQNFYDIVNYLNQGDVLVLNNTKVMPARLIGKKVVTGGRVEVFLLKRYSPPDKGELEGVSLKRDTTPPARLASESVAGRLSPPLSGGIIKSPQPTFTKRGYEVWQCLVGGKKRKENLRVEFTGGLKAEIIKNNNDGTWNVKFNKNGASFMRLVEKIGQAPLPPYISSTGSEQVSRKQYQTIYADDKKLGSVAAPTAGFHFTKNLIRELKKKGVQFEEVALRVGLGTFAPVKVPDITKHKMHAEWIEVSKKTLDKIVKAKSEGRRIIAVGTTSARTLETVANKFFPLVTSKAKQKILKIPLTPFAKGGKKELRVTRCELRDYSAWTDIFIYPGYKFKAVDAMITNFHLPKSTLLMLVSALAGRDKILRGYQEAIKRKYRFYSYGDAMLIL